MALTSLQDLRRIAEAVEQLRGRVVQDVEVRSDCRALRLTLAGGDMLLVSVLVDDAGKPRLDMDLLHRAEQPAGTGQLEVRFGEEGG